VSADVDIETADENGESHTLTVNRELAVVVDPADSADEILAAAGKAGYFIKWILLTHGHFDHTGAASAIKAATGAEIYIHGSDNEMLTDSVKSLSFFTPERPFAPAEADKLLKDGDKLTLGNVTFTVVHTPGHTAGSVCFLCDDPDGGKKIMLSGDTLFRDSIGRSDTYSGDPLIQHDSLDKLKALTDDYIVLPGHGEATTLAVEKKYNPFIADF
jgi:glyoxylase-like metal-dependent hydrolase (beta-lactamase superfamily II)